MLATKTKRKFMGHFGDFKRSSQQSKRFELPKWFNGTKWEIGQRVSKRTWRMIDLGNGRAQSESEAVKVAGTITSFSTSHPPKALVQWDEQPEQFKPMGKTLEFFHNIRKEES